jgi:hypothetical protein
MHPLTTMCSTARSVALLAAGLLVGIPFPVQQAQAQTRKVAEQKDEAGHTKHVPFVSFDTFSEAPIYRATGRKTPEEEAGPGVTLVLSSSSGLEQREHTEEAVAGDTLTLAKVRRLIVGTWIENVAQKLGNYERGALKWVFTEEGTFREYRRSESGTYELSETYAYSIVDEYKETQAPEDIAGYLEFTDSEGDTHYMTIESIHRGEKRPHLYVGTHGMAGNTESIYLMPPRVFE